MLIYNNSYLNLVNKNQLRNTKTIYKYLRKNNLKIEKDSWEMKQKK